MGAVKQMADLRIKKRVLRVLELRRAGWTWERIADRIREEFEQPKYSAQMACADLARARNELIKATVETAGRYRALEVERLDILPMAVGRRVASGELGAIDRVLRIIELRSKLTGAFAPVKVADADGGPLRVEVIAQVAVNAIVAVVDEMDLPLEKRAAV